MDLVIPRPPLTYYEVIGGIGNIVLQRDFVQPLLIDVNTSFIYIDATIVYYGK